MAEPTHRIATLPNILGLGRIAATPVVVALLLWDGAGSDLAAAGLFFVAGVTDLLDGRIARSRNQVTPFGVFMDLAADKVLAAAVLVAMVEVALVPAWMAATLLVRELVVQAVRQLAAAERRVIGARGLGKAKTLATLGGMFLLILARGGAELGGPASGVAWDVLASVGFAMMLVATALAVLSGVLYLRDAWPLLTGGDERSAA
jgi:CDP-diacylglycerol---glycerol-3-phosphate 3-phosphatidyltransferase